MTTIVYYNGYVFADSKYVKGDETFNAMDKIHILANPLVMGSKVDPEFNDVIYAYACTGAKVDGDNFINMLESFRNQECNYDRVKTFYEMAIRYKIMDRYSPFVIMLIGKNKVYGIDVHHSGYLDGHTSAIKKNQLVMGAGTELVLEKMDQGFDPVRAMQLAGFVKSKECGGNIEACKIVKSIGAQFYREGIYEQITNPIDIAKMLQDYNKPLNYDYCAYEDKRFPKYRFKLGRV